MLPWLLVSSHGLELGPTLCHTAVSHLARYRFGIPEDSVVRERCSAPELALGKPALGIYVDNVYSIGCAVGESLKMVAAFVDEGGERSLRTHWESQDSTEGNVLGVEVWGTSASSAPVAVASGGCFGLPRRCLAVRQ